jgi:hypothetical protein
MTKRVSQISLAVFAVLIVLIPAIATISGKYWPFYAFASVFGVVPLLIGPRWYRLFGALALVVTVVLIVQDYRAGQEFRARFHVGVLERLSSTNRWRQRGMALSVPLSRRTSSAPRA